jgi:hypothetical protein
MKWRNLLFAVGAGAGTPQLLLSLAAATNFADDLDFLKRHTDAIVLSDTAGQAQAVVVPAYQGRVMTSTARGPQGASFGWINRALIASGQKQLHINIYGGEDRFWLGPEGGQFSIFFAKDASFELDHWHTPAPLDTEPFTLVGSGTDWAVCERRFQVVNYSGTRFDVQVTREVRLVNVGEALARLGTALPPEVSAVGFESVNTVNNAGADPWRDETGLLSIWILGMLTASPNTTVVFPFKPGTVEAAGPMVNDAYFGPVPPDRLVVKNGVLFFRADANHRSKIGLSPRRAKPLLGSYDAAGRVLTLVQFTLPAGARGYVNSMWKLQDDPYRGDAVNSYNDGPAKPGEAAFGNFYELETSSPALALAPGEAAVHCHRTMHLQGPEKRLDPVARALLGVSVRQIKSAFDRATPATPSRTPAPSKAPQRPFTAIPTDDLCRLLG